MNSPQQSGIAAPVSASRNSAATVGARGRPCELPDHVLEHIVRWRHVDRMTLRAIADRLARFDVPTTYGGRWHASTVSSVLASQRASRLAAEVGAG